MYQGINIPVFISCFISHNEISPSISRDEVLSLSHSAGVTISSLSPGCHQVLLDGNSRPVRGSKPRVAAGSSTGGDGTGCIAHSLITDTYCPGFRTSTRQWQLSSQISVHKHWWVTSIVQDSVCSSTASCLRARHHRHTWLVWRLAYPPRHAALRAPESGHIMEQAGDQHIEHIANNLGFNHITTLMQYNLVQVIFICYSLFLSYKLHHNLFFLIYISK